MWENLYIICGKSALEKEEENEFKYELQLLELVSWQDIIVRCELFLFWKLIGIYAKETFF